VGSVTGSFQSESPLHPSAQAFLEDAFDRGWADPSKIHQESRSANILLNEAKETLAAHLGTRHDQVEFLADPTLGFHLGISGLLDSDSHLYYSAVDRSEVFAVAGRSKSTSLPVGLDGSTQYPNGNERDVLAWQSANGETGIISQSPEEFLGQIFVDSTASGDLVALPQRWSAALWNSRAWSGPAGLAIFAVRDKSRWHNPLPHLEKRISSTEFSLPLALASAIALEAHASDYRRNLETIRTQNSQIRSFLTREIADVDIASKVENTLAHLLSFSILYTDSQYLVSELDRRGFAVDSGSACSSANMEPSHVLAAMGVLTHGNVRMNLHTTADPSEITEFLKVLKALVSEARA
jgi:cysteine desulfurase